MDNLGFLPIKFHFHGKFVYDDGDVNYVDGVARMSYIERDKMSLPEIKGHLGDHITVTEQTHLHWLFPGLELNNGLRLIIDDKACSFLLDSITEGGVVNVYVENYVAQDSERSAEGSYWEDDRGI